MEYLLSISFILIMLIIVIILIIIFNRYHHYNKKSIEEFKNPYWLEKIDKIFIINLEKDYYKYVRLRKELISYGIPTNKINRFNAVYNKYNGHIGCAQSHYKLLLQAEKAQYKHILVLEDDFSFAYKKNKINKLLDSFFNNYPDFDVLQLYSMYKYNNPKISKYLSRSYSTGTTTGIILSNKIYGPLSKVFREGIEEMESHYDRYNRYNKKDYQFNFRGQIDEIWRRKFQKDNLCYLLEIGKEYGYKSTTNTGGAKV